MTVPPSSVPPPAWAAAPTMAIPAQRPAPAPMPPVPAPKQRRRWPWALGGLVVGLVIGVSAHGGSAPATTAAATPAPARASAPAPIPAPTVAPATQAPAVVAAPTTVAPAPAAPAGPATSFSDGVYEVGTDIAAGKYKTAGSGGTDILDSCYYEIGDGSGRLGGIDKNDNLVGPGVVTLKKGKVFTTRGGCTWTKSG
jgi:hypothetical protein